MISNRSGAARSALRWMNMERTTTARAKVSSSYSSRTAPQSRHLHTHTLDDTPYWQYILYTWLTAVTHLSVIFVGCSSPKSSGAGTNMLAVLGAESRLVFVRPVREQHLSITNSSHDSGTAEWWCYWPVSHVLMFCGALDWCSNCLFINWHMVTAPRDPRFTWRYWAVNQTHTFRWEKN